MKFLWIFCFLSFPLLLKSKILETTTPPKATKKDKVLLHHGDKRVDSFYWLREKENPEVIKYLNDENTYTQNNMWTARSMLQAFYGLVYTYKLSEHTRKYGPHSAYMGQHT